MCVCSFFIFILLTRTRLSTVIKIILVMLMTTRKRFLSCYYLLTVTLWNITSDMAFLSWSAVKGTLYYTVISTDLITNMSTTVLTTNTAITGLNPNTNYNFSVQATTANDTRDVGIVNGKTSNKPNSVTNGTSSIATSTTNSNTTLDKQTSTGGSNKNLALFIALPIVCVVLFIILVVALGLGLRKCPEKRRQELRAMIRGFLRCKFNTQPKAEKHKGMKQEKSDRGEEGTPCMEGNVEASTNHTTTPV